MKERPILFSGTMVRALLDGSKTQTRRIVKPQPMMVTDRKTAVWDGPASALQQQLDRMGKGCPYGQPGDRLWVRETCRADELSTGLDVVRYLADNDFQPIKNTQDAADAWLKLCNYRGQRAATVPGIHMPRWASRIALEVTGVRAERLQDISDEDAKAEGADCLIFDNCDEKDRAFFDMPLMDNGTPYRNGFALLWEEINGAGSWAVNPWVWVVEFKRVEQLRRAA